MSLVQFKQAHVRNFFYGKADFLVCSLCIDLDPTTVKNDRSDSKAMYLLFSSEDYLYAEFLPSLFHVSLNQAASHHSHEKSTGVDVR